MQKIDINTIIKQCEDQVSTQLDGETVLMSISEGNYFGMNPVLSRIWELIEKPIKVSDLRERLLKEYDVEKSVCEKELLLSLNKLASSKLLDIS